MALDTKEAIQVLVTASRMNLIRRWDLNVASNVTYYTQVEPIKRRADGTVGRRADRPWYSDRHSKPEPAIVVAACWVINNYPELPL